MAPTKPCTRHSPRVWMAYCADCTAWHLQRLRAAQASRVAGT
jgi:hypothetical protein